MKTRINFSPLAAILTLVVAFVIAFSPATPMQAQNNGGAGLSTGLFSPDTGQSVRIAVVNVGGKDSQGEFIFVPVTEQGKATVPIRCNWFAAPGDTASATFSHPGGANRIDFYAQVRVTEDVKDLESLVPSLQIIDDLTGRTEQLLSGSDFAGFQPIFIPPLVAHDNTCRN